ncbi:MAG: CDP-alcohol phosphatidyltransferase family protein [Ruminococcaceae bacterium]|nr:CDP-alcohol phosphatidyltransferase family protein [Oscillospiraceae bacterium]
MNVPNTLSFLRILLIPVFCITFMKGEDYYVWAGAALALSALSDLLDGWFARKFNQITELGKWLDPIADKLTLGAVVLCMWLRFHGDYPELTPLFAILVIKELLMAIGGMIVVRGQDEMIQAQWWGKVGTAVFYTCMLAIVVLSLYDIGGQYQQPIIISLVALPAAVMVFAFVRYFIFALSILRQKKIAENGEQPATTE